MAPIEPHQVQAGAGIAGHCTVTALWILGACAGLAVAIAGSKYAVDAASALARRAQLPRFFVGITVLALGTDLPEIANSVISCLAGHGDLTVGNSNGSVTTQLTLILGLVPFVAGSMAVRRAQVALIGGVTVFILAIGTVLVWDGYLSRADGGVLVLVWGLSMVALWRQDVLAVPELREDTEGSVVKPILVAMVSLAAVGGGAALAVKGFIEVAESFAVPEYLLSFFATSLGTSLPELVVVVVAQRSGESELAVGDAFGSSLMDASLSLGAGPLVAPAAVTASLAVRGSLVTLVVVAAVTFIVATRTSHDRRSGAALLAAYAAAYLLLIPG